MSLETLQQGRYRIIRPLGNGSMGEVYLVEDTRINRQVAIKIIRTESNPYPGSGENVEASRLFEREAKAIARLNHSNILSLYDFGEEVVNGVPLAYMVMPYAPDGSLSTWLQQRGSATLPPPDVAHFVREAAAALQHAHEKGIIHQDVKPQNFLIRRSSGSELPDLLLADFGISRLAAGTSGASQAIRGTPLYMAPEQWEGQPVPASDQYSLAIMAYQLLTGRTPFQGGPSQMMFQHFSMSPMPPSAVNPALSPEMDTVLLRALAKRPQDRYPTIMAFADAFQQAAVGDLSTFVRPNASLTGSTWIPPLPAGSQSFNTSGPTVLQNNHGAFNTSSPTVLRNSGAGTVSGAPTMLNNTGQFGNSPVAYPPAPPFGSPSPRPPQEPPRRTSRTLAIVILVIVLVLLLGSIGGVVFYMQSANSASNANATATAQANNTLTANNNQSATAGSNSLTATAQSGSLTATANAQNQSSANATATAVSANATGTAVTQGNINQNATATAVAATATAGATPFAVQSVAMSVNPSDVSTYTCGTTITVTYTATFTVSGTTGGTVQFTYTTDNGRSDSGPQTLTFAAGETSKAFTFTSQGTLSSGGTFPGTGIVQVTSPNTYTSKGIQPTGQCH